MTSRKNIKITCSVVFFFLLAWYFLIKENDYCISFKVQASRGTIYQGIQEWTAAQLSKEQEKYSLLGKKDLKFIKQNMIKGATRQEYTWEVSSLNDSVCNVSVSIKDLNHSWYNKLTVPFFNTTFKKEQIRKISEFKKGLLDHIKEFKVKIEGEGTSEETFVAYIALKSILQEKGQTMIGNDASITGFLYENKIKIIGRPYVEITNWDNENEAIEFNYCFPIAKETKIVANELVKYKTLPAIKGLTATYYGNFRTSDRAWFALMDYAERRNLKLESTVLEHFLANPFNGGNELEWETKVVIPFKPM